jgi:hypothetical protein
MATSIPPVSGFHKVLLSIEHLVGYHPDDPNYAKVKAEIAKIQGDHLTAPESLQLDATIKAIETARATPPVAPK